MVLKTICKLSKNPERLLIKFRIEFKLPYHELPGPPDATGSFLSFQNDPVIKHPLRIMQHKCCPCKGLLPS